MIYQRVSRFFEDYDALIIPAAQVPPFDANLDWVSEINGVNMPTYIDWMAVCCMISVTGLPAISVPGGFSESGLPIGVQIVGKPRGDLELLRIARAFETATEHGLRSPNLTRYSLIRTFVEMTYKKLLLVMAHPDDAEFSAGGLMTLWHKAGHQIKILCLTNGNAGHHTLGRNELAARRLGKRGRQRT